MTGNVEEAQRRGGSVLTRRLHLRLIGAIVVLDQLVKWLVGSRLEEFSSIVVIPGLFNLTRVHNTGVAYGFLDGVDFPGQTVVLALVATVALVGLAVYASALADDQRLTRVGLSFVIGGAAGNLIDRLRFGYVLDFFDVYWSGWHFWAFNVADAAITVGVSLMILDILLGMRRPRVSRAV
jgi:signal peptidase II